MGGVDGAEEDHRKAKRDKAGLEARDQGKPAEEFGHDHDIGEEGREADGFEKACRACGGEDEDLQPGMKQEPDARGHAQQRGGEVGG